MRVKRTKASDFDYSEIVEMTNDEIIELLQTPHGDGRAEYIVEKPNPPDEPKLAVEPSAGKAVFVPYAGAPKKPVQPEPLDYDIEIMDYDAPIE